jgi:hypothetical protein
MAKFNEDTYLFAIEYLRSSIINVSFNVSTGMKYVLSSFAKLVTHKQSDGAIK